jgi:hypothetical protein
MQTQAVLRLSADIHSKRNPGHNRQKSSMHRAVRDRAPSPAGQFVSTKGKRFSALCEPATNRKIGFCHRLTVFKTNFKTTYLLMHGTCDRTTVANDCDDCNLRRRTWDA